MEDALRLPAGETAEVELDVDEADLRALRARAGNAGPEYEAAFARYLVYLGAGLLEAERAVAGSTAVEAGGSRR